MPPKRHGDLMKRIQEGTATEQDYQYLERKLGQADELSGSLATLKEQVAFLQGQQAGRAPEQRPSQLDAFYEQLKGIEGGDKLVPLFEAYGQALTERLGAGFNEQLKPIAQSALDAQFERGFEQYVKQRLEPKFGPKVRELAEGVKDRAREQWFKGQNTYLEALILEDDEGADALAKLRQETATGSTEREDAKALEGMTQMRRDSPTLRTTPPGQERQPPNEQVQKKLDLAALTAQVLGDMGLGKKQK